MLNVWEGTNNVLHCVCFLKIESRRSIYFRVKRYSFYWEIPDFVYKCPLGFRTTFI